MPHCKLNNLYILLVLSKYPIINFYTLIYNHINEKEEIIVNPESSVFNVLNRGFICRYI